MVKFFLLISFFMILSCSNDYKRAQQALKCGDYNRAILFSNKILDQNPANQKARLLISHAYIQKLDLNNEYYNIDKKKIILRHALNELNIYNRLNSQKNIKKELAILYTKKAELLLESHDTIGSIRELNRSIKFDEKNINAMSLLGSIYYHLNKDNAAKDYFLSILSIDSLNTNTLYNLSVIYYNNGNYKISKKYFDKYKKLDSLKK